MLSSVSWTRYQAEERRKDRGNKVRPNKTSETSSSESDMFFDLIQKGGHKGDDLFQTLMQLDEGTVQEIMSRMKLAVVVEGGASGIHSSSFEAVE